MVGFWLASMQLNALAAVVPLCAMHDARCTMHCACYVICSVAQTESSPGHLAAHVMDRRFTYS